MTATADEKTGEIARPRDPRHRPSPKPGEDYTGWMVFRERGPLDLRKLTADDIDIRDIVYSLANTSRFNGQTRTPVSVLWHSLMVQAVCADRRTGTMIEALFHDAGEAYTGDWISPIQSMMGADILDLRRRIHETCFEAAGLRRKGMPPGKLSRAVDNADKLMLRYEAEADWGYGSAISWHRATNELERRRVEKAMQDIGRPSCDPDVIDGWIERFMWLAHELVPKYAPLRRSMHETLVELASRG